jgi:predicted nucleotidyltransferase
VDRDTVIETLKAREDDLRALGVRHTALFGCVARGEASDASNPVTVLMTGVFTRPDSA